MPSSLKLAEDTMPVKVLCTSECRNAFEHHEVANIETPRPMCVMGYEGIAHLGVPDSLD